MNTKRRWWSVMLLYPEYASINGPETWYGFVQAANRDKAIARARHDVREENDWLDDSVGASSPQPEDFEVLLVLAGRHVGV